MTFCLFTISFCPKVASPVIMKQGHYSVDEYIKEDSFIGKLQPKMYVLYVYIFSVLNTVYSEIIFKLLIKSHFYILVYNLLFIIC